MRITPGGNTFTNPAMAMSAPVRDGVYGAATNMARFIDADPTPDEYLYHRLLCAFRPRRPLSRPRS